MPYLHSFRLAVSLSVSLDGWKHHVSAHCLAVARFVARSAFVGWFELLFVIWTLLSSTASSFVSLRKHCVIPLFSVHPRCVL